MNQCLKDAVYNRGSQKHVDFMAKLGGMTDEEKNVFQLIHEGQTDLFIQEETGLSRTAYRKVEDSVRAKLLLAVFECINECLEHNHDF